MAADKEEWASAQECLDFGASAAIQEGSAAKLGLALRLGASPSGGWHGVPHLIAAIEAGAPKGSFFMAQALIDAGADPSMRGQPGMPTPLGACARAGWGDGIRALAKAGADPVAPSRGMSLLHELAYGSPAWGVGASDGSKLVSELAAMGADPNSAAGGMGWTPLHLACMAGRPKLAKELLAAGADPSARDALGRTPDVVARLPGMLDSPDVEARKRCSEIVARARGSSPAPKAKPPSAASGSAFPSKSRAKKWEEEMAGQTRAMFAGQRPRGQGEGKALAGLVAMGRSTMDAKKWIQELAGSGREALRLRPPKVAALDASLPALRASWTRARPAGTGWGDIDVDDKFERGVDVASVFLEGAPGAPVLLAFHRCRQSGTASREWSHAMVLDPKLPVEELAQKLLAGDDLEAKACAASCLKVAAQLWGGLEWAANPARIERLALTAAAPPAASGAKRPGL